MKKDGRPLTIAWLRKLADKGHALAVEVLARQKSNEPNMTLVGLSYLEHAQLIEAWNADEELIKEFGKVRFQTAEDNLPFDPWGSVNPSIPWDDNWTIGGMRVSEVIPSPVDPSEKPE